MKIIKSIRLSNLYKHFLVWRLKNVSESQYMLFMSFLVGLACGLAAVVLKNTVHYTYLFITDTKWFAVDRSNFLFLVYPMVGITLTVLILKYFIKDDLSHGVSKVMYAISRKKGHIKPHNTYSSIITSSITVAFGGSVGLEAPIVLTGSALGSNLGRIGRLSTKNTIILVGCGAAGAIAGAFKAPIAGILFVFEVLMLDLTMTTAIPLLISAITSSMISYFFLGKEVQFTYDVTSNFELIKIPGYIFLGIISAFVSLYFLRSTKWISSKFKKITQWRRLVIGGISLGILIFLFPPLFGEGYAALSVLLESDTNTLFNNTVFYSYRENEWMLLGILIAIVILKAIATSVTTSAGGVGGTFAPSLFIGGFTGFFVGRLINMSGLLVVEESNFALVGMAAVMSGVMHSPLSATFLIAEITGGYALFAPLMIATTISYIVVKPLNRYSIYADELAAEGNLMTHNKDKSALQSIDKRKLIETNFIPLLYESSLRDIAQAVQQSTRSFFPIIDKNNNFLGIVLIDDVRKLLFKPEYYDVYGVKDFIRYSEYFIVDISDPLEKIVSKFKGANRYTIAVVDDGKYIGFMSRANVYAEYRKFVSTFSEE
ncbi:MAG: chloride channel protein [Bacteroidales bacterium]|nr:chloride channel protein [Bacteroidales bacterium]MDD4001867.1 chloride channel protein [Bacteroidales bacterium]MDD4830249.1 chloride channel protein [Bacteroidales bacterium]